MAQHLLLTARHGAGQLLGPLFEPREGGEDLLDVGLDLCVVARVGTHLQVFGDGHAGEDAPTLGHHHQAFLDQIPGAFALDALAQVFDVAGLHAERPGDGLHGGGFARAVGADQRDQLFLAHFHVDALDRLDAAVRHLQATDFQQCVCHF